MSLTDYAAEAEVALYSQGADGAFVEINQRGYVRLPYAERVTFKASEDWPPITHVATIVRGEVLLRPVGHVPIETGQTLALTFSGRAPFPEARQAQCSYIVGQWMTSK